LKSELLPLLGLPTKAICIPAFIVGKANFYDWLLLTKLEIDQSGQYC
jgi:hypothetical protein